MSDFEDTSWTHNLSKQILDEQLVPSISQIELYKDNDSDVYKRLKIPQGTKYIEITLCYNIDSINYYAQLGKNEDDVFPSVSIINFFLLS